MLVYTGRERIMKKLIFCSLLLFCSMSHASVNEELKLEDLRDSDNNPIKPTSAYRVSITNLNERGWNNEGCDTKGSNILELLASYEDAKEFTIEKEYDPSIMRSISEYYQQVLRTIGIQTKNDSDSDSDSDSDTDTKSNFARCCRSKKKNN